MPIFGFFYLSTSR